MKQKDLLEGISSRLQIAEEDAGLLVDTAVKLISEALKDGKSIGIQGFGNFEVKKKEERLSVHPSTKIRTLIPPKLVVSFKHSIILKNKLKDLPQ